MAGALGVSIEGLNDLHKRVNSLPARLDGAEQTAVRKGAHEALVRFRVRVTGMDLKVRSGAYRNATNASAPTKDAAGWKAEVGVKKGPAEKYAALFERKEESVTIKPKRGKVLAIPIGPNLTPAGVARFKSPRDPRMFGGFWKRIGDELLFLVPKGRDNQKGARIDAWFLGVPEVVIHPPRPLTKTLADMQPRMRQIVAAEVTKAIGRV